MNTRATRNGIIASMDAVRYMFGRLTNFVVHIFIIVLVLVVVYLLLYSTSSYSTTESNG